MFKLARRLADVTAVLCPPSATCLDRLRAAAAWTDRDLDRALCDVGILPPADLAEIRTALAGPDVALTTRRNADGHAIIEVTAGPMHDALLIHHDGRVQRLNTPAA